MPTQSCGGRTALENIEIGCVAAYRLWAMRPHATVLGSMESEGLFDMPHELPIPPAAETDPQSLEMIRVWLADRKLHCVLNVGFWESRGLDEASAWGTVLADVVHHIANAHEAEYGRDPRETINAIVDALKSELARPTSKRLGQFHVDRQSDSSD
ncbi:DUF5076 domain-containing protein [Thalassoroseus pseudoceratinae]|uniref:DUF5076 domain-containing protein n=1 Tax=Thalassoroseus pseudoceratinae TaxID=2713176 RepID=UPI00197F1B4A|nr:DUF5076 domain-containing protein [Thalassoroseus pseudoceratinae]